MSEHSRSCTTGRVLTLHMCAQVLSQNTGNRPINLFVSRGGKAYSDATFSQYWTTVMDKVDTMGQPHFPPSKARTMYVERITSETGLPPDMWDGVAAVMDNTTRQVGCIRMGGLHSVPRACKF